MNRMALRVAFLLLAASGLLCASTLPAQNAAAPVVPVQAVKAEAAPGATAPCPTPKTEEISEWQKQFNERMLHDFPWLGKFKEADAALALPAEGENRVVFMGDSITQGWTFTGPQGSFPSKPYINRGISGQTTPQMLVRVFPDVVSLKPAALLVLAGTNDIAGNTGPATLTMIEDNLQAITELAQAHGIKVILCSVTPVSDYTARTQTAQRPPPDILKLNAWMREYAAKANAVFADYYAAMVDETGMLKQGFSGDGLHPNDKGYALLVPVAEAAIAKALP